MKNLPLNCVVLAVAGFGWGALVALAQDNQLDVGVRAAVVDKPFGKTNLQEAPAHGKIYGILGVFQVKGRYQMIKPVDAKALQAEVCHELELHGFHQVVNGQQPEILITVLYARSGLINPYLGTYAQTHSSGVSTDGGEGTAQTITGTGDGLFFRQMEHGIEQKIQKAQFEKLCLKVTAWEYPKDPKSKAKQLWNVIMNVDDPDHRDLNAIAAEMLAAGSPYFDKEIKEEEVDVYRPLPEGHVKLGTPEVVGTDVKKTN